MRLATKKVEDPSVEVHRTCSICLKKNHVRANCPDNPFNRVKPAVHVVVGNIDKYESGEEDDFRQIRCFLTIRVECSKQKSCFTTSVPSAHPKERARMDWKSTVVECFAILAS